MKKISQGDVSTRKEVEFTMEKISYETIRHNKSLSDFLDADDRD